MKVSSSITKQCSHDRQGVTLDSLSERLRLAGMKLTNQRKDLLDILLHSSAPISADEISKKSNKKTDALDLVTIYRCLKRFEELNLITRLEFGDGISRFELTTESGHHHHHVICRKCSRVEPLHICDLDAHIKMVECMGYTQLTHRLEFFGICSSCQ